MSLLIGVLGMLSALTLTGAAVSVFALQRAHKVLRDAQSLRVEPPAAPTAEPAQDLRDAVAAIAAQVHELQRSPAAALDPAVPRPGLNLSKRSQALRLHRRGESAEKIAAELQLPRQEVDLLVKVHRIVLSTV